MLRLRVQPRASRNAIRLEPDGRIRVTLTSPPVDGRANKALVELLAGALGTPKSSVVLVSGETSRDKSVSITGVSASRVRHCLMRVSS